MNIFIVDTDPRQAARDLCDKHVVKMTLETAQLLCTTAHTLNLPAPYNPTHTNHPCAVWARSNQESFVWLLEHGLALCSEYTRRFNKIHKSEPIIKEAKVLKYLLPIGPLSPFALCVPYEYRQPDPVLSYRTYYNKAKASFARWTAPAQPPTWFIGH